jgi:hypothetical protein
LLERLEKLASFKVPGWLLFVEALREEPRRQAAILDLRDRKKRR